MFVLTIRRYGISSRHFYVYFHHHVQVIPYRSYGKNVFIFHTESCLIKNHKKKPQKK